MNTRHAKPVLIAIVYGFAVGAIAALTLALMQRVQHLLWSTEQASSPWYIFAIIMAGGTLLAWLQHLRHNGTAHDGDMESQLATLHSATTAKRRDTLLIALSAIVAVGFGGAVGPEAGLLAVAAGCSSLLSARLASSYAEQRLINDTGAVAALSGLYGAPPGAAVMVDEHDGVLDDAKATPLPVKFLAGVCGFGGFLLVNHWIGAGSFQQLPLPEHTPIGNGSDMLLALPAALAAAVLGLLFVRLHHALPAWLEKLTTRPARQILLASAAFALMAALFPLLRFSGHHELEHALEHGIHAGVWTLIGLAFGKVLAMAVCLAGGWRGGEFFPAIFAASALAAALHLLIPGIPLTVAIIGGSAAIATVCMGKPVAVLLIMLLIAGTSAPGALFVGILTGHAVRKLWLTQETH